MILCILYGIKYFQQEQQYCSMLDGDSCMSYLITPSMMMMEMMEMYDMT